jgi:hypothetical protein
VRALLKVSSFGFVAILVAGCSAGSALPNATSGLARLQSAKPAQIAGVRPDGCPADTGGGMTGDCLGVYHRR